MHRRGSSGLIDNGEACQYVATLLNVGRSTLYRALLEHRGLPLIVWLIREDVFLLTAAEMVPDLIKNALC
jgi:hypothetical protein